MTLVKTEELANVIAKEVQLMTSFLAILKNEEQILVDNTPEKLDAIIAEKNTVLVDIISLEKQRNQLLTQSGFAVDADGIKAFIEKSQAEPSIETSWKTLLELSANAKENNRTNGILISRQMARNQSALNTLQQSDQTGGVYGADGQARSNLGSGRGIIAG